MKSFTIYTLDFFFQRNMPVSSNPAIMVKTSYENYSNKKKKKIKKQKTKKTRKLNTFFFYICWHICKLTGFIVNSLPSMP